MPIEVGYVPDACLPDVQANTGQFLAPLGDRLCGTSAQVAGQRRNRAGSRQQGLARARTKRRTVTHPALQVAGPRDPRVAEYQVPQPSAFAAMTLQQSDRAGRPAPESARQQSGERGSAGHLNRTSQRQGHRNPTSLQIEQDLSQREMSKELAKIRAKTSELGEKSDVATDQFECLDGRATCGPGASTRRGGPGLRGSSRFVPPCFAPISEPWFRLFSSEKARIYPPSGPVAQR